MADKLREMFTQRRKGNCPFCGEMPRLEDFRDELSMKEFGISGICQKCQDDFFGEDDVDEVL